jgi:hypothetical protein
MLSGAWCWKLEEIEVDSIADHGSCILERRPSIPRTVVTSVLLDSRAGNTSFKE